MSRTINTRTKYKIIGSDYSAQEPRMTTHISGEPKMYEAYQNGKDLYAIIAQSAFHNEYWENLEYWPESYEVDIDGKKVICGSGKEKQLTTDTDNSITIPNFYLVETEQGELPGTELKPGMKVISDIGDLVISAIEPAGEAEFLCGAKPQIKIIFAEN